MILGHRQFPHRTYFFTLLKMPKKAMLFKCKANYEYKNLFLQIFYGTMKYCCTRKVRKKMKYNFHIYWTIIFQNSKQTISF